MARTKGLNGLAIGMVGVGGLLIYSAIKGTSPLEELRALLTGKTPEALAKTSSAAPLKSPAYTPTPAGGGFGSGKVISGAQLRPHVRAVAHEIADTWGVEVQGFSYRNIAGTSTLSDHALGLAVDAMTTDLGTGNAIVARYKGHPQIKYIIWQNTIWSPGRGNRRYAKNDHKNHVHLSFYATQGRAR